MQMFRTERTTSRPEMSRDDKLERRERRGYIDFRRRRNWPGRRDVVSRVCTREMRAIN